MLKSSGRGRKMNPVTALKHQEMRPWTGSLFFTNTGLVLKQGRYLSQVCAKAVPLLEAQFSLHPHLPTHPFPPPLSVPHPLLLTPFCLPHPFPRGNLSAFTLEFYMIYSKRHRRSALKGTSRPLP